MVRLRGKIRPEVLLIASCVMVTSLSGHLYAQSAAERVLLAKAQSLVAHGHLELAVQTWQQVLLSDPAEREALLGIARADMQLGKREEAKVYIQRLRNLGSNSAELAEIETMPNMQPQSVRLNDARRLAQEGRYADAMKSYRDLFPQGPPAGDTALEFYETEAAIPELRREATDHLQVLAAKFSADPRYAIALGRILTYDPKTRAQGITLLSRFDSSAEAQQALKQALSWNGNGKKSDTAPIAQPKVAAREAPVAVPPNPAIAKNSSAAGLEASAYRALNSGHLDQAEQQFQAVLSKQPQDAQALSGLGYVAMKRSNFVEALDYLEKARAAGATRLDEAIATARFWSRMAEAGSEQKGGDSVTAARDYRDALALKPGNSDAEEALAGALMQTGNNADAVAILKHQVVVSPQNEAAWRELFVAQARMSDWREALATTQRMPRNVESRLETDPEYLRFLIQGYLATGRKQDADRITERALALPFPNQGRDLSLDKQMQYAALLMAVQRFEPALRLYRQVVNVDSENAGAWRALVAAEHQLDRDDDAIATLRSMPRSAYDESQNNPGFLALLGSIYQARNQLANAGSCLEKALSIAGSSQPGLALQLADVYIAQGEPQKAYSIYRRELDRNPSSKDAWRGLVAALHQSNHDREALRELATMPTSVHHALEQDSSFLQTLASIQSATSQDKAALQTFDLIMQVYVDQQADAPADVQIQYGWLLLKADDNRRLYSVVSRLSQALDLTADQQGKFDKLWASWSVRRANSALTAGEQQRAIAILETAAQAFPRDVDVYSTLAGAYLQVGQPKRAVAIYASFDLRHAGLAQYQGAIGAALAAHDLKRAETWLQAALDLYKDDAALLKMAAQYEQARGDAGRAEAYYRAALNAMGPESPAEIFSHAGAPGRVADDPVHGSNAPARELMRLLEPSDTKDQTRDDPNRGEFQREADISWRDGPHATHATLGDFGSSEADDRDETSRSLPREENPARLRHHSVDDQVADGLGSAGSRITPSQYVEYPSWETRSSSQSRYQDKRQGEVLAYSPRESDSASKSPGYANDSVPRDSSLGDLGALEDVQDPATPRPTAPIKRVSLELPPRRDYIEVQDAATREEPSAGRGKGQGNHRVSTAEGTNASEAAEKLQDAVKNMETPQGEVKIPFTGNRELMDRSDSSRSPIDNASDIPLPKGVAIHQLSASALPPLTGAIPASQAPITPREQIQQQLAVLEGGSSSWIGGTSTLDYRSGQPGYDRLAMYSGQAETSGMLGPGVRTTFIVKPVLLDAGQATGTETIQQGTLPLTATPYVQSAAGTAGEFQLQTANFGARVGTTPRGFLIQNYTGGISIHPASAHFRFDFARDPILDTQLSFAGLRDEGSVTATFAGNSWGGVIANSGELQVHSGDALSGWYVQGGGQYLTGLHVANNERIDGDGGAYWTAWHSPEYGSLVAGMNFFGMHYERNLRYFTYGQGGYFSPGAYMLAAVPLTFNGHYGPKFHYRVVGSLGMQAFQEDSAPYFPLDPVYQAAKGNPTYPERTSVGGNYNLDAEGSYSIADHWYVGAYTHFNNSRDYASDQVGFFVRFLSRGQPMNQEAGPTGLFPIQGMRPLQTP
jgi:tetratricopeptide (TPR) repeat protein